jgi:3-hydroxy-9,10-secoandrosta-1,3,5(10)-triene-9,17-dione monooxygenase
MVAPSKFAHVVYQTHNFEPMVDWYVKVFEGRIQHKDEALCFMTYDDEHHRMAFVNLGPAPGADAVKPQGKPGVHHVAYTWDDLGGLVDTYKRLKGYGVLPKLPIRHGLTLSMYYADPDENMMEFQVDLMDPDEANAFMHGNAFAANPVGEPFDPEELAQRYDAGEPVDGIIFRSDQPESTGAAFSKARRAVSGEAGGRIFLEKVDAALDEVRRNAPEAERIGRCPEATVNALTQADVFRAVQPRRFGGTEIDPGSFFEGVVRVGSACGSAGWVAGVVGVHAWHVAMFDERAQREVWDANPDARIASTYAPTGSVKAVKGGFVLNGRWSFSSGIDCCEWVLLGGIIPDDGEGPEFRTFLVPRRDFTVDGSSWNVTGLSGSGSKDVICEEAFVPDYRTHRLVDVYNGTDPGKAINTGPLFRMPWLCMFAGAITSPALGAATGALESFMKEQRDRFGASVGQAAAQNPSLQLRLVDALTTVNDLRARQRDHWADFYGLGQRGEKIDVARRAQFRYEGARAIIDALKAVQEIFEVGGGGVMRADRPFQRFLRDLMAMRNHPFAIPDARGANYAKLLLGVPLDPFSRGNLAAII